MSRSAAWRFDSLDGLVVGRCEPLERLAGLGHAFSTRLADGRDDFDLGGPGPAPDGVRERRLRLLGAAGLGSCVPYVLRQVHGDGVVRAGPGDVEPRADAAVWTRGGRWVPAVRTADCVAVLLADREGRAAAAVHAGWRGTAAGIAGRAVAELRRAGVAPGCLVAALGPAILRCCYEVDREVRDRVAAASDGADGLADRSGARDRFLLDLHEANRRQLRRAGVPADGIHAAPWCTRCRGDRFFSFRREGASAGRMMAVIGGCLTARPA